MATDSQPGLVLVVEDNPANLLLTTTVLERAGYRVASTASPAEAISIASQHRPCVILMDISLGGADGLDLTRALKNAPDSAGIPILAVTAHAMKGDRERAMAAGCDGFLTKPIDTRTFAADVSDVINRAKPVSKLEEDSGA